MPISALIDRPALSGFGSSKPPEIRARRMPSRSRRLIRLRCGASPSLPGTMSPIRSAKDEASSRGLATACIRPNFPSKVCPRLSAWNSAERVNRPSSALPCGFAALAISNAISPRPVRRRSSCGHERAAPRQLCGHPPWPCAPENHAGAYGRACSADRCVSRDELQSEGRELKIGGLRDRLSLRAACPTEKSLR